MSDHKSHQSGFGSTSIIVIALVVLAISGIGYVVFKNSSDKTAATTTTSPSAIKDPASVPSVEPEQATSTINFELKELGIQLTIPDSLKDIVYSAKDVTLPNGVPGKVAYFSTTTLASADVNCSADHGPLGALQIVQGQYPKDDNDVYFNYGNLLKQFPQSFVTYSKSQGLCTTTKDATLLKNYQDTVTDFKQAVQSVELSS
jgi:hypothetical protein